MTRPPSTKMTMTPNHPRAATGSSRAPEAALAAAQRLRTALAAMDFAAPVTHVYNPLDYAWDAQAEYVRRYLRSPLKAVFLGMNPGPWGMVQTGIPFGEVPAVRDWLGIRTAARRPANEHPKRPIDGLACKRSEVSGRRLWGLFAERFATPEAFFREHFVINYCPLAFLEETGRNHTPDKLPASEAQELTRICDRHLEELIGIIRPEWVIGVGAFAENRAREVLGDRVKIGRILHPSPASPAANRDWPGQATTALVKLGIWS